MTADRQQAEGDSSRQTGSRQRVTAADRQQAEGDSSRQRAAGRQRVTAVDREQAGRG